MKHLYRLIAIAFLAVIPSMALAQSIREKTEMLQHQVDSLQARLDSLEIISRLEKQAEALQMEIDNFEDVNHRQNSVSDIVPLKGRKLIGTLPFPSYNVKESGTVVVTIWVDPYGNVVKAQPGADGTTVTSRKLWAAARDAAMKAHFNKKTNAPALQQGAITYIFK